MRLSAHEVPYIAQLDALECGAACLAMILGYQGHHAALPDVRAACAVSRDGVNALAMVQAAQSYGLEAIAYSTELTGLSQIPLPAILHWEFNHFVVLERLHHSGGATIVDPARGRLKVSAEALGKCFTGVVLAFTPTPALTRRRRSRPQLGRYRSLVREHRGSIMQVASIALLLEVLSLAFPVGQQILVDRVIVPHASAGLWSVGVALMLAPLTQCALLLARGQVVNKLQMTLDLQLLGKFMHHVVRLPVGFFLQRSPGDLLGRLEGNSALRALLGSQIATSILDIFLLLGYATLMLLYDWQLGLLVLAVGCARAACYVAMRHAHRRASASEAVASSGATIVLVESLSSLETIRSTCAESFFARRWSDRVLERSQSQRQRMELQNLGAQLTGLLNGLGLALVCAAAGAAVISGKLSIGVFCAFMTLQGLLQAPINNLIESLENLQHLGTNLARMDDVFESDAEQGGARDAAQIQGDIRLEKLSYRYSPGAPWSLRGIDLHIRAGEMLALVGQSGAGKSTLARAVLGMVVPSAGTILFDGQALDSYDLEKLRQRIGVVLQEVEILNDTVLANITLNDPSITAAAARAAAQAACLDQVIEALPLGYSTRLGEAGVQLSGGERQRLCLARALARRPSVLILDEATSAVDEQTEERIHANLSRLGCTRIVIAHRFNTVRNADRILVLKSGRIAQLGTFGSLADEPGLFQDLLAAEQLGI
jgi:ABC-type bacteriocin/lantibiotic exporter with double-glycine peptidase domain